MLGMKELSRAAEAWHCERPWKAIGESAASAALHDPFMPSCTWVTLTHYQVLLQQEYNLGYLWDTVSLCFQKTLPRRCHLNDAGLFLITANFLASANQHQ